MRQTDIQTLVALRLEDMADQVSYLLSQGLSAEAEVLRQEGLMLAEAYDNEDLFLYVSNFSSI